MRSSNLLRVKSKYHAFRLSVGSDARYIASVLLLHLFHLLLHFLLVLFGHGLHHEHHQEREASHHGHRVHQQRHRVERRYGLEVVLDVGGIEFHGVDELSAFSLFDVEQECFYLLLHIWLFGNLNDCWLEEIFQIKRFHFVNARLWHVYRKTSVYVH